MRAEVGTLILAVASLVCIWFLSYHIARLFERVEAIEAKLEELFPTLK